MEHTHLVKGLDYALLDKVSMTFFFTTIQKRTYSKVTFSNLTGCYYRKGILKQQYNKTSLLRTLMGSGLTIREWEVSVHQRYVPGRLVIILKNKSEMFSLSLTFLNVYLVCPAVREWELSAHGRVWKREVLLYLYLKW